MYWLYVRSTVPWCLFDLYVLAIQDQQYLDVFWCLFDLYVLYDLYVLAICKINSTLMSVWPVWLAIGKINSTLMLFDLYVLAIRKINSTLMSVWPVCIDYTKDQQYLDVCLTCVYWLYVRSTVPWCLFDLYVLTIRKINCTLMSVWPVCIGYTYQQ